MADSKLTLPATGEDVSTYTNASSEHQQVVVIALSDGTLIPGDGTAGWKVNLGADNDVTITGTVTTNATLQAGTAAFGRLSPNSGVDIGDVDVTSVVPGTSATQLGKAIDTAAGATDTGIAPLAIRDDTLATLTPADGDYAPLRVDDEGKLWTRSIIPDSNGDALTFATDKSITASGVSMDTSTAYAAGDSADSTIWTFADAAAVDAGSGWISRLIIHDKTGTGTDFRVYFLNTSTSITPPTENDPFSLDSTETAAIEQVINTADGTWYDTGTESVCIVNTAPLPYKLSTGTSLFAVAEVLGALTCTASTDIVPELYVSRN